MRRYATAAIAAALLGLLAIPADAAGLPPGASHIDLAAVPAYPYPGQVYRKGMLLDRQARAHERGAHARRQTSTRRQRIAPRGRQAICRHANRHLVEVINAKLRRWVHRTGRCGAGQTERLATFYWQGRRTATGARFNPNGMTAAHLSLAFGTRLRITNPHNGRSVGVTVNDRGPCTIADIDLALGAARRLGLRQSSYVCVTEAGAWTSER